MFPQIAMLFSPRQPAAIRRFVIAKWIDAVKCQAIWAWSHVGQKHLEIIEPAITHGDATRSVKPVVGRRLDVAATFHAAPTRIFAMMQVPSVALKRIAARAHCHLFTAATLRVAAKQVLAHFDGCPTAVAVTQPKGAWRRVWRTLDNNQLAEPLVSQILHRRLSHVSKYDVAVLTVSAIGGGMKVWIVEHGEYSERHVVAVTDDEAKAESVAILQSGTCTMYELNEFADRLLQGYRRWRATFLADGSTECLELVLDYSEYDLLPVAPCITWSRPSFSREVVEIYVNARIEREALKIASEKRHAWQLQRDLMNA